ncbi:MAG: bifunctional precorrin-2 dehydrogenase/sirohydrochlorin ferrochelatase [Firmicutes bacterium]|nr:bifunctional precorrin-2 dehydrogenase/sirohydrochlorin ferrochelatase [Bacillota bacterium]
MKSFPFIMNIENKRFLIVGGGRTAARKLGTLRKFDAEVTVIAQMTDIQEEDGVRVLQRAFEESDLAGMDYVIAATGSEETDAKIAALCKAQGIPVNTTGDAAQGDFYLPATIKEGPLIVAVSTSGTSPAYARKMRQEIEKELPPDIGEILERIGSFRKDLMRRIPTQEKRQAAYEEILGWLLADHNQTDDEVIEQIITHYEIEANE